MYADRDFSTTIALITKEGNAAGINLPIVLNWDKNKEVIQLEFKPIQSEKTVYFFTGMMFFNDVSKIKKEIWFSKEMEKKVLPKNTVRSISNNWLSNLILDDSDVARSKISNLQNPGTILKFKIRDTDEPCAIVMNLYIATDEKKSGADKKIETISEVRLNISLLDLCLTLELTNAIDAYQVKIDNMGTQIKMLKAEMDNLEKFSCPTIKEYYGKPAIKEEKIHALKAQYQHYNDCENLKATISDYNATIDAWDLATRNFNSKLYELQAQCPDPEEEEDEDEDEPEPEPVVVLPPVVSQPVYTPPVHVQPVNCQTMRQANERLAELLLDIKNSKSNELTTFKQVFEKVKHNVSEPGFKSCKEYKAYEDLCKRIETRLK
jgi:hypothetical protein